MKTLCTLTIILLASFQSRGQFGDNRWMLGGNFSVNNATNYTANNNDNHLTFGLGASMGRIFGTSNVVGLSASTILSSNSFKNKEGLVLPETASKSSILYYSAYYRKYYSLSGKFFFFIEGSTGLVVTGTSSVINGNNVKDPKDHLWTASIAPGLAWKVSEKILLNGNVNFASFVQDLKGNGSTLRLGVNLPTFGISYLLK